VLESKSDYYITFIYASNEGVDRRQLWLDMEDLQAMVANSPWLLAGDFNVIKAPAENFGGLALDTYEQDFKACTEAIGIEDHPAVGCYYTWTNRREDGHFIVKKLDRVLVNHAWYALFPQCIVQFLPPGISDHSAALISIGVKHNFGPKPFKFFNHWTDHKDFLSWVEEAWATEIVGSPMYTLARKLKVVKAKLRDVDKDLYGCIFQKVNITRQKLEAVQSRLMQRQSDISLRKVEHECLHELTSILGAEEAYLKQKARNKWLQLGDQNNRFFYNQIKARQARNAIKCLIDSDGNRLEDPAEIKQEIITFYQQLFGQSNLVNEGGMMNRVSALISPKISDETKYFLQHEVTEDEIRCTLFSLGNEKASGPDGFTAHFFKKSWSIVGKEVCLAVKSFFQSGSLLKEFNSTIITPVPKVPNPSKVAEFRPIACCNVLYKCITKILANRLNSCLSELISSNQTAFVKGRNISENILLAQELVKGYHKNKGKARCAIKVDLKKAYDSVEWSFILMSLLAVGCPPIC
jgi:hypothetical protein